MRGEKYSQVLFHSVYITQVGFVKKCVYTIVATVQMNCIVARSHHPGNLFVHT